MSWATVTKNNLFPNKKFLQEKQSQVSNNNHSKYMQEKQKKQLQVSNNNHSKYMQDMQDYYWNDPKFEAAPFIEKQILNSYVKLNLEPPKDLYR